MATAVTSSLRSAREWRGLSLPVAARTSGLPLAQVEALEAGDASIFASVDEMVAAAVLYGATLGIGTDEALALLDRSIAAAEQAPASFDPDATGEIPLLTPQIIALDAAGRDPSAGLLTRSLPSAPEPLAARREVAAISEEAPIADLAPLVPPTFEPGGAIDTATKLDAGYRETVNRTAGELDAWVASSEQGGGTAAARPSGGAMSGIRDRAAGLIGEERWYDMEHGVRSAGARMRGSVGSVRQWANERPYGTLVLALVVGAIMAGVLFSISALIGGNEESAAPAQTTPVATAPAKTPPTARTAKPRKVAPVSRLHAPAKVKVDVLNAGSTKGLASDTAGKIDAKGYNVVNVGNTDTTYSTDVVLYRAGYQRDAQRIARLVGIKTFDTIPQTVSGVNDVIVVTR